MEEDQAQDASGDQHRQERQHALTTSTPQVQKLRTNVQGGLDKAFTREWDIKG
jgi:hypothetical protein